jgi:uncharacterized protein (DUF1015 family)
MITLSPIARALVPEDSRAAEILSAPNYDEFQGDEEIRAYIAARPHSVLGVTMAHARAPAEEGVADGSPAALALARRGMEALRNSDWTRELRDLIWVYEILDPRRPGVRQIGVGGMASVREIRTESTPGAPIIRNEGVREPKARARAALIEATDAIVGMVNLGVDDRHGRLEDTCSRIADAREPDLSVVDERDNRHAVWFVDDPDERDALVSLVAAEPVAYVADGNHRSAAAAMAGLERFVAVFFPTATMGIRPYNRLVAGPVPGPSDLEASLARSFEVERATTSELIQPRRVHQIGLYTAGVGFALRPLESAYDPANAVSSIDADIVQREIFAAIFGIPDPRDPRLTFVGSNRDVAWLKARVDERGGCAIALPPVSMEQFVEVCRQNRMMPPKSTWFEPKVRSGLVVALL